jgi:hypothetical protein
MGCYPHARFHFNQPDAASVIFTRVGFHYLRFRRQIRMMIAMFSAGIHGFSISLQNKPGYALARKYAAFLRFRDKWISAAFGCRTVSPIARIG